LVCFLVNERCQLQTLTEELEELEIYMREEVNELSDRFDPQSIELEAVQVKPFKKDIDIESVSLLWVPFDERDSPLLD